MPALLQTRIREAVSPYLPPPVVRGIQRLDPQLRPYVGAEGTVTVVSTLLFAWIVLLITRLITSRLLSLSGRAIADDDDVAAILRRSAAARTSSASAGSSDEFFDATVLLTGPPDGGKTRLFYQLSHGESDLPTLMSIKANLAVADGVRYLDWPGYAGLDDDALQPIWKLQEQVRIVLVLDSTQPVAAAADSLYQILDMAAAGYFKSNNNSNNRKKKLHSVAVFVACHKKDLAKAKTFKRVKIQLRTELERLLRVKATYVQASTIHEESNNRKDVPVSSLSSWWPDLSKELDLDQLPFCKLHFASTTSVVSRDKRVPGNEELLEFCRTGKLPATTTTTTSNE